MGESPTSIAGLANFLNDRGRIPQRRGRGRSDGVYDEGFSADRRQGYTCDFDTSLAGADRAFDDIRAALAAQKQRPDVAPSRVLIEGQSRGGILSVAYAGMHPDQILGVLRDPASWEGPLAACLNTLCQPNIGMSPGSATWECPLWVGAGRSVGARNWPCSERLVPVVHRGPRATRSAHSKADAAARGEFLWTHRCKPLGSQERVVSLFRSRAAGRWPRVH